MKLIEYINKKVTQSSILEKIVLFFIILLTFKLLFTNRKVEGLTGKNSIIKYSGSDVFNKEYVNIYDDLVYCKEKNVYEINIVNTNKKLTKKSSVLDIGCGTGHHVNLLTEKSNTTLGIDISPEMIKKSQSNYPKCNFKVSNVLKTMEFSQGTFTHITCFYFTIYYIKDKEEFFKNCFYWLKPGGILVVHLVNIHKFDPILPPSNPLKFFTPQRYVKNRITTSEVIFNNLNYKSDFILDKKININQNKLNAPNAIFKEKIKNNKSNKVVLNEHEMYMISQKNIVNIAQNTGFSVKSIDNMDEIQYNDNYLYTFIKPH